ncbi:MAG: ExbD/TolR family protein [Desulfomonilaceae bacterium]
MWSQKKKARAGALDITPLVDMVFLLIIFFLLSTTFRVLPGVRVDLPEASSQKMSQERKDIVIAVDQAGLIFLDREPIERSALEARLRELAQEDNERTVFIRGDRNTNFGTMVDLLGTVKKTGLHRIAIMTHQKKEEGEARKMSVER